MNRTTIIVLCAIVLFCLISSCEKIDEPGNLVPATVDQNSDLPQISIHVAAHDRAIHCLTFGQQESPPLYILHGSLSDMRAYIPLAQSLSEKYYVVLWDMRGNGLSERVTSDELSYEAMVEEIEQVRLHFSPNQKITLIGHSWSAIFAALFLENYHENIRQIILMEPFGLNDEVMSKVDVPMNLTTLHYLDMNYSTKYLTAKSHEELDFQMLAILKSGVRNYFCDIESLPEWPVWRIGGLALIVWERNILDGTNYKYDFTEGLEQFSDTVLLIGSECSPIGYTFQKEYNASFFQHTKTIEILNSGHRMLTEQFDSLTMKIQSYLYEYH